MGWLRIRARKRASLVFSPATGTAVAAYSQCLTLTVAINGPFSSTKPSLRSFSHCSLVHPDVSSNVNENRCIKVATAVRSSSSANGRPTQLVDPMHGRHQTVRMEVAT
jgi:hypothetical protein